MAYSSRIDTVTVNDETILISRTEGDMPLALAAAGEVVDYATRAQFIAAVQAAEARVSADLWLIRMGRAYKADPTFGPVFVATSKALPAASLDFTGLSTTIAP